MTIIEIGTGRELNLGKVAFLLCFFLLCCTVDCLVVRAVVHALREIL